VAKTDHPSSRLRLKRAYEAPAPEDGQRVLVDRLWPRGLSKAKAQVDLWLKEIAPSDALRRKLHADPRPSEALWDEFCDAYARELQAEPAREAVRELTDLAAKGPVTLLYAAKDEAHNNARALKAWLEAHPRKK
jgi:uncharacterized protein YeaO (DUF488 family)